MIDTKKISEEHFDTYIISIERAVNILDYANRLVMENGGQEHIRIARTLPKIIASKKTSLRIGRWINTYAEKNNIGC